MTATYITIVKSSTEHVPNVIQALRKYHLRSLKTKRIRHIYFSLVLKDMVAACCRMNRIDISDSYTYFLSKAFLRLFLVLHAMAVRLQKLSEEECPVKSRDLNAVEPSTPA